ncbi:RND transporter [Bryobacterales bacterium F-183]|nr:RND transporter [Bryobacterales bacterium F-183]
MRGKWMLFGGIAVFLAVGAGAVSWWTSQRATQGANNKDQATAGPQQDPNGASEVSLPAKIQAQEAIPVASPIEGIIDELFVEVGADVYEGQLIARVRNGKLDSSLESATAEAEKLKTRVTNLEASIVAARLEASRAAADAARVRSEYERLDRNFQRQQMLLREGATPRLTFEKAEKDFKEIKTEYDSTSEVLKVAEERVSTLNRDLDAAKKLLDARNEELENAKEEAGQGEVKSPVDGMVVARKGAPGEPVSPAMPDFFVLAANLSALQAVVEPDPSFLPRIKPGQIATIHIAESTDEIPGLVREIKANQVLVDFVSPGPAVKPGLSAQVRIFLDPPKPAQPVAPKK